MYRLAQQRLWRRWRWWCQRHARLGKRGLALLVVLGVLYGLWPSLTLWRLNQAVLDHDLSTLATFVEVTELRAALRRRLNKDEVSAIGALSDDFIDWLDAGIRYHGVTALEQLVTLDWVHEQLWRHVSAAELFPAGMTRCFVGLREVEVRFETAGVPPLVLFLRLEGTGWRVVTLYY